MKIIKSIVIIAVISIASVHCSRYTPGKCRYYNPPSSFFFIIKHNGVRLSDSILQNVKISYWENGTKQYMTDLNFAIDSYASKGILTTRNIGAISADKSINTFNIEYTNGYTVDTLYLDYRQPSVQNNCLYVMQSIKFNGQQITVDTSFHYPPVYILNTP